MEQPSYRLLLIEDDRDILESMAELLQMEGFRVEQASNGVEALALLEKTQELPDLLLLDLMMPVMDGVEFRENQRSHPRFSSIPVIVLSADSRSKDRIPESDSLQLLQKPVDIDILLDTIRATLGDTVASSA